MSRTVPCPGNCHFLRDMDGDLSECPRCGHSHPLVARAIADVSKPHPISDHEEQVRYAQAHGSYDGVRDADDIPIADWNPKTVPCDTCGSPRKMDTRGWVGECDVCGIDDPVVTVDEEQKITVTMPETPLEEPPHPLAGRFNLKQEDSPKQAAPRVGVMSEPVVLPPHAKLDAMSALEQRFLTLVQLHSRAGGLLVSFAAEQTDAKWVAICEQYSQMGDMMPKLQEVIAALRNQQRG